jgi:AcrR family transcriptional regulator
MSAGKQVNFATLVEALSSEDLPHMKGMGRRERKAAQTRLKLFRCALQLFAERGFPNVTVEDITEAADVGKGTFFNYFSSKDHVLSVMAEIQLGKVREALQAAEDGKRSIRLVLRGTGAQPRTGACASDGLLVQLYSRTAGAEHDGRASDGRTNLRTRPTARGD